jgi:predicted GIY-YIG superfamily endonuclease
MSDDATTGTIYLLHFERPISDRHTTRHYLGWARNLDARIKHHRQGTGARLTQVAHERGITFEIARIWKGDRNEERRLKNSKRGPRLCPTCNGTGTVSED